MGIRLFKPGFGKIFPVLVLNIPTGAGISSHIHADLVSKMLNSCPTSLDKCLALGTLIVYFKTKFPVSPSPWAGIKGFL